MEVHPKTDFQKHRGSVSGETIKNLKTINSELVHYIYVGEKIAKPNMGRADYWVTLKINMFERYE